MAEETPVPDPQPPSATPPTESRSTSSASDAWVGAVFWVVILLGIGYYWLFSGRGEVVLNVSGKDTLVAEGRVMDSGMPVVHGAVQVLVEDPKGEGLVESATTDVNGQGAFRVEFKTAGINAVHPNGLRVTAHFDGRTSLDDKGKPVQGSATVYVNMTPPWRVGWGVVPVVAVLLVLATLFTGPLPPRKARLLFGFTYLVTFSACVIPILLTIAVSQSPYLLETMQQAPVGIVKARAKGLDESQWLVNIGGSVQPRAVAAAAAAKSTADGSVAVAVTAGAPGSTAAPAAPASGADGATATATKSPAGDDTPKAAALPVAAGLDATMEVLGGLAIPLYVLVLAMFGAGINMTRMVPEIQNDYDTQAAATPIGALSAPATLIRGLMTQELGGVKGSDQAGIRQQLIETYMYFLSAPFLAVAVYYLLQVIATSVAQPVLVVIAFATGLMSSTAVGAIMAFADTWLAKAKGTASTEQAQAAAGK